MPVDVGLPPVLGGLESQKPSAPKKDGGIGPPRAFSTSLRSAAGMMEESLYAEAEGHAVGSE